MARKHCAEPLMDTIPEYFPYQDDGCEVSQSCLRCPLPRCKYDDPAWYHRQKKERRDTMVMEMRQSYGKTVAELARDFNISQRTVFRILSSKGEDGR